MSPDVSRRAVLRGAGIAGAAVAVAGLNAAPADAATVSLKASTFQPLVGKAFHLDVGRWHHTLKLHSIHEVSGQPGVHEDAFSLRFTGPKADREGGETGRLHLPAGETTTLFIVPGGKAGDGQEWIVTVLNVVPHV